MAAKAITTIAQTDEMKILNMNGNLNGLSDGW